MRNGHELCPRGDCLCYSIKWNYRDAAEPLPVGGVWTMGQPTVLDDFHGCIEPEEKRQKGCSACGQ